jgi:hypothetical protein
LILGPGMLEFPYSIFEDSPGYYSASIYLLQNFRMRCKFE